MSLRGNRGFTLIELVIALSLAIAIFVVVFAAMRLGYMTQQKGLDRAEVSQETRILGDRISWLIRGTYPFYLNNQDMRKIFFQGDSGSIGFVTTSVDTRGKGPEDRAGLKWVQIFSDSKGLEIREKVYFLEDVFDNNGGKLYLFDPAVKKIEFEYLDISEGMTEGEWVSEWDPDTKNYYPSAVKFRITFDHNGKKIEVPEIIIRLSVNKKLNL